MNIVELKFIELLDAISIEADDESIFIEYRNHYNIIKKEIEKLYAFYKIYIIEDMKEEGIHDSTKDTNV